MVCQPALTPPGPDSVHRADHGAGRWIVGARGGSMQATRNLSLYRLLKLPVSDVVSDRHEFEALGLVDDELLPI
jgi:hypothetical protein